MYDGSPSDTVLEGARYALLVADLGDRDWGLVLFDREMVSPIRLDTAFSIATDNGCARELGHEYRSKGAATRAARRLISRGLI